MKESRWGLGQINVSNDVVAELAGFATLECYGVVGMASSSLHAGVAQLLSRDKLKKGIKVNSEGAAVKIKLYVIVEYGINMAEVAHNLMSRVKYDVEKYTQVKVANVDVFVQGVKVEKN